MKKKNKKKNDSIGSGVAKSNNQFIAELPKYNNLNLERLKILQENSKK
jgi:hypothetical protein